MGSGQQVALPGLGKWWSGNAGTTPWGVKRTLVQMKEYLTRNESARPQEMPSLVHSLIGKLYPQLSEAELLQTKQTMLDRIYDVRDSYFDDGKLAPSKQPALGKAMQTMLSGTGFEALLRESGLDPATADLANNGAGGSIANSLGKRHQVEALKNEYREKYTRRSMSERSAQPSDFLRSLLDSPKAESVLPNANDNSAHSFAKRLQTAPASAPALGA
jgi:hypothetical protein